MIFPGRLGYALDCIVCGCQWRRPRPSSRPDNANNLNLAAFWSNNVAPGIKEVATWNHLVVNNTHSILGVNLNWSEIEILDPVGPVMLAAGNALTNSTSGIDLSLAANSLTLGNNVVSSANQTRDVANGQTLTVAV